MSDSPMTPPSSLAIVHDYQHTRFFLTVYYALAVVWGARHIFYDQFSILDFLVPLSLTLCLGWWAIADARRRRTPIPLLAQAWFVLFAGLVVPGYVIWSRRWVGVGWIVTHAVMWYVLATICMHLGGMMIYGQAWLRGLGL